MPISSYYYQIKPSQQIQSSSSLIGSNTIILKNQNFYPQYVKITTNQLVGIKVSYNNNYSLSEYGSSQKKYIFAIQQLQQQSSYLSQGQQYIFHNKFIHPGEYQLVCINLPKIKAKIIVEKCISQQQSQSICDQIQFDSILLSKEQLILKSPIKLEQVKQQCLQQQLKDHQEQDQHNQQYQKSPSLCPKSHQSKQSEIQQQYQRILTQEDNQSLSLQNKYLKYFKEQFKLWRNFFQQKQKDNLKSKHTKNLSLSQVKQIQQKNILYDQSVQSDSQNLSSMGKNISIASQLYSHQEIIDRGYEQDINSSKKQMKKTNSQYGFNIARDNNDTPDLLQKIKSFQKQQIKVNLNLNLNINLNHSRRSDYVQDKKQNNKNKVKSINRTQANSPMLKQIKKQNNFITWAQEWAIQKQYSQVKINKKNDEYLLNQCITFMKNSKFYFYPQNIMCPSFYTNLNQQNLRGLFIQNPQINRLKKELFISKVFLIVIIFFLIYLVTFYFIKLQIYRIVQYKMSNKDKKSSKIQAKRQQEQKKQQQQLHLRQQFKKLQQKQQLLRKKSNPLVQYGLLDGYEFFMQHLATSGIPQSNVFEFAAQSMLKYQKKLRKKKQQLQKIQQFNKSIIQQPQRQIQSISTNKKKNIKPNMLPFKGQVDNKQLQILNKLKKNNSIQTS